MTATAVAGRGLQRFEIRTLSQAARFVLIAAGFAWGLWAVGTAFDEPQIPTEPELATDLFIGLAMQWLGVYVWGRPSTGRTGPLLYLSGLLWYVGSVWDPPPLGALTFAWRSWYDVTLLVVILGWPTGHLRTTFDKAQIGILAGVYLLRSLVRLFLFDGGQFFDDPAWHNPFAVAWNQGFWESIENLTLYVSAIVGLSVAVTCLVRWSQATRPARRTLTPMLVAGVAMVPLLGWTALSSQFPSFLPEDLPIFWIMMGLRAVVPLAILIGIYRLRTSPALARLLVELDRGVPIGGLEAAMGRALSDPSLRIAFRQASGSYVDAAGQPFQPVESRSSAITAIRDDQGDKSVLIVHDPALDEDPDLLNAAASAARLSLLNERLQAEVRAQLEEVRASRARLVEASDAERRRVERDLHDGAQQRLVTLALQLNAARERAATPDPELTTLLSDASVELDLALGELRELARGIHPAVLSRAGLGPAVATLAERCPIPVDVSVTEGRCASAVESTAYFIVAEALTNIVRYSSAKSARVTAHRQNGSMILEVTDDGIGGADPSAGSGLRGLEDRVAAIGGHFQLLSPAGAGTQVRATLPCG